jgi:predicted transcriptional regulator of viral defense system
MMKVENWLDFFKKNREHKIFHFNHLKLMTGMNPHALRVALKRLNEKKLVRRISRGYYLNPFSAATLEEISAHICAPSYISLESALSRYGILSQIPQVLTCVTTKLPRVFNTFLGTIEYRQVKKEYFFGFVKKERFYLAEPEKAFLDLLYLEKGKRTRERYSEFNLKGLSRKKLNNYAGKMALKKKIRLIF